MKMNSYNSTGPPGSVLTSTKAVEHGNKNVSGAFPLNLSESSDTVFEEWHGLGDHAMCESSDHIPVQKIEVYTDCTDAHSRDVPMVLSLPSSLCGSAVNTHDLPTSTGAKETVPLGIINCRCGLTGDSAVHYRSDIYGAGVKCDSCHTISHVACQRYGRASYRHSGESFECDRCDINHLFPTAKDLERRQYVSQSRKGHNKALGDRLRPGCGALARHGHYFYPVRIIQKSGDEWIICWWRDNIYEMSSTPPPRISRVQEADLVDSLWCRQWQRRRVRLGRWTHACDVQSAEDILSDPESIPYTTDIDNALSPYRDVFVKLSMSDYENLRDANVPAKRWLETQNLPIHIAIIPHVGHLSVVERAQVANWFDIHVTLQDRKRRLDWLGRLPIAHAYTVYIAHLLVRDMNMGNNTDQLLDRAWDIQVAGRESRHSLDIDIDAQCLSLLEEDMFEVSEKAGIAGYYQWGLDSGHHQGDWDPYAGMQHLRDGGDNIVYDDIHLKKGALFVEFVSPQQHATVTLEQKPRPRPRPIPKRSPYA